MTDDEQIVAITITAPDADWLANHTRYLVEQRLAACGNIIPNIRSIYRWQNNIEDETEAHVTLHTRAAHIQTIIETTNERHPYETVHVVALPALDCDREYGAWVLTQTT
jgi:periplasmic divalent cation tolerance protein